MGGRRCVAHVVGALRANSRLQRLWDPRACGSLIKAAIAEDSTATFPGLSRAGAGRVADLWARRLAASQSALRTTCVGQRWRVDDTLAVVVCRLVQTEGADPEEGVEA